MDILLIPGSLKTVDALMECVSFHDILTSFLKLKSSCVNVVMNGP